MNVQHLRQSVLAAVLAAVMTLAVQAQNTEYIIIPSPVPTPPAPDYSIYNPSSTPSPGNDDFITKYLVWGNNGTGSLRVVVNADRDDLTETTFATGTITITTAGDTINIMGNELGAAKNFTGIYLSKTAGRTLSFANLSVQWNNAEGTLYGLYAPDTFSGTLNTAANLPTMTVLNTLGSAVGYQFGDLQTNNINLGAISVTAGGTGNAIGLDVTADTDERTLTIRQNVSATSTGGDATAIKANGINITLNTSNNPHLSVTAKGATPARTSIEFSGEESALTIAGNNTFTNGNEAFVVKFLAAAAADPATDGKISFNTHVNLTAGLLSGVSDITVAVNRNVHLGNTGIDGGAFNFTIGRNALFQTAGKVTFAALENSDIHTISGSGKVYLTGDIKIAGGDSPPLSETTTIKVDGASTILGISVAKITLGNDLTIDLTDNGGILELYGTAKPNSEPPGKTLTIKADDKKTQIIQKSIFGEWKLESSDDTSYTLGDFDGYSSAQMSDAYLAAAMIRNPYTGWSAVSKHFISAPAPRRHTLNIGDRISGTEYRGQSGGQGRGESLHGDRCMCEDCVEERTPPGARLAWGNYAGRGDTWQGWPGGRGAGGNGWKIGAHGVQFGVDCCRSSWHQFGILFGYERGTAKNAGDLVEADDYYLGFYAARVFRNGVDARFLFNQGWQQFDMVRSGWDARFNGHTQEFNLELGRRFHYGTWSLRPLLGADIFLTHLGKAEEQGLRGGFESVEYDKTNLTQVFLRTGFDLRTRWQRLIFNTGLSYAYDVQDAELRTRVREIGGQGNAPLYGSNIGGSLLSFIVGGEYVFEKNFSLFGGYEGRAALDRSGGYQSIGQLGGLWRW